MFQFPGFAFGTLSFQAQIPSHDPASPNTPDRHRCQTKAHGITGSKVGFPIRKCPDQSLFAAPRTLSQRTTSFIASQRQGIHRIPLSHLIASIIDAQPLGKRSHVTAGPWQTRPRHEAGQPPKRTRGRRSTDLHSKDHFIFKTHPTPDPAVADRRRRLPPSPKPARPKPNQPQERQKARQPRMHSLFTMCNTPPVAPPQRTDTTSETDDVMRLRPNATRRASPTPRGS